MDRAALDAAMACGLPVGGWCPKGRWAEDGPIDPRYPLRETPTAETAQRTTWNVRDSDATLVILIDPPVGGTSLTIEEARRLGKPWYLFDLSDGSHVKDVLIWLRAENVWVLNVAGPRESETPGIYEDARAFLEKLFEQWKAAST